MPETKLESTCRKKAQRDIGLKDAASRPPQAGELQTVACGQEILLVFMRRQDSLHGSDTHS